MFHPLDLSHFLVVSLNLWHSFPPPPYPNILFDLKASLALGQTSCFASDLCVVNLCLYLVSYVDTRSASASHDGMLRLTLGQAGPLLLNPGYLVIFMLGCSWQLRATKLSTELWRSGKLLADALWAVPLMSVRDGNRWGLGLAQHPLLCAPQSRYPSAVSWGKLAQKRPGASSGYGAWGHQNLGNQDTKAHIFTFDVHSLPVIQTTDFWPVHNNFYLWRVHYLLFLKLLFGRLGRLPSVIKNWLWLKKKLIVVLLLCFSMYIRVSVKFT